MSRHNKTNLGGRMPARLHHTNGLARATRAQNLAPRNKRSRTEEPHLHLPFTPPEDWHEPKEHGRGYKIVVQPPGAGYRHVLTPDEVHARLAQMPPSMTSALEL